MADPNIKGNAENPNNENNQNNPSNAPNNFGNRTQEDILRSIDATLKQMLKNEGSSSQSGARDARNDRTFRDRYNNRQNRDDYSTRKKKGPKNFTEGIEQSIMDNIFGEGFQEQLGNIGRSLAKDFGVELEDLPGQLGKNLTDMGIQALKKTGPGKALFGALDNLKNSVFSSLGNTFVNAASKAGGGATSSTISSILGSMGAQGAATTATSAAGATAAGTVGAGTAAGAAGAGTAMTTMTAGATSAAGAMAGLSAAIPPVLVALAILTAGMLLLDKLIEGLGPAIEGTKNLLEKLGDSANRSQEEREQRLNNELERQKKDYEAIVEEPFKILKEAAEKVYEVWDANLRMINATQGYSKSDLQDLMADYASRLRSEGLSNVVGGNDIVDNLTNVLKSGLSGAVAEEFAYTATLLSAAVPTQDFFNYADTYASLAANAIKNGKSEAQAIAYANEQLKMFASNVLYASRQIAGGFTTGLQSAEDLFKSSVQIAQASRTGDPAQIAGVLTSVSAITGAIAPDLASSITDAIVKAATGGNSSEIVALRSLAGINASNTEFLRQLASNPQSVFESLFRNLADMQNMSQDAYMEVAEGLSSVFGLSMDAFARVDFNYLADAISSMNVNTKSLEENMQQLASGETTTTTEQLRLQKINEYMIEEGLAYVLDNEVARSIQEHMWDEQLANEIMENEFSVNLKGAALEFLEGIRQTVDNIVGLLNPFSWIKKAANLFGTAVEGGAKDADVRQILELGKVGNGNPQSLYQLTTRGVDLNLTPGLATMMGGISAYDLASGGRKLVNGILSIFGAPGELNGQLSRYVGGALKTGIQYGLTYDIGTALNSMFSSRSSYGWSTLGGSTSVSKGASQFLQAIAGGGTTLTGTGTKTSSMSAEEKALQTLQQNFSRMMDESYMAEFVDSQNGYDEWKATASRFGIKDFDSAIGDLGYSENDLMNYFQAQQTAKAQERQQERLNREDEFWKNSQILQEEIKNQTVIIAGLVQVTNQHLVSIHEDTSRIYSKLDELYVAWDNYFVKQTVYRSNFTASDKARIDAAEKDDSKKAVYALAEALTSGNKDLLDPTMQTNALLSQILLVVQAIMQQNNDSGGTATILDTIQALSTGLITTSNI